MRFVKEINRSRVRAALISASVLCLGAPAATGAVSSGSPMAGQKASADGPEIGSQAPDFTLPDIQGRQVSLADFRGRVVALNFWAFWCDTWKAEMPHLRELAPRQDELGFRLVAVSVDGARLPEFLRRAGDSGAPFPVLLDDRKQVSAQYRIAHVPTVVIIDRNGKVRYTARAYPGNFAILRELRKIASAGG